MLGDHLLCRPDCILRRPASTYGLDPAKRKNHGCGRPLTCLAVEAEATPMHLRHNFDERQAKAGTSVLAVRGALDLDERLQNPFEVFYGNADTGVRHGKCYARRVNPHRTLDMSVGRRELAGVGEEIEQHLPK